MRVGVIKSVQPAEAAVCRLTNLKFIVVRKSAQKENSGYLRARQSRSRERAEREERAFVFRRTSGFSKSVSSFRTSFSTESLSFWRIS